MKHLRRIITSINYHNMKLFLGIFKVVVVPKIRSLEKSYSSILRLETYEK